jgi:hypothetical protein
MEGELNNLKQKLESNLKLLKENCIFSDDMKEQITNYNETIRYLDMSIFNLNKAIDHFNKLNRN